jgi:hypothetical protein
VALALYLVALTLPWYRTYGQGRSFWTAGWQFTPLEVLGFLLLAFSWGNRGRAGRLVLRDGSVLLFVCTVAGAKWFGLDLVRTMPHLRGAGITWGVWLALVASAAATVLATLLARGMAPAPANRAPELKPLAAWPFVLPLLAVPIVELVPAGMGWQRPAQWAAAFTFSVLLAAWALLVRRGVAPEELGVRITRELARLVALIAVVGYAAELLRESSPLSDSDYWRSTGRTLPFLLVAPLIAWFAASAWVSGGYRNVRMDRIPEILRVDRLGPEQ